MFLRVDGTGGMEVADRREETGSHRCRNALLNTSSPLLPRHSSATRASSSSSPSTDGAAPVEGGSSVAAAATAEGTAADATVDGAAGAAAVARVARHLLKKSRTSKS